MEKSRVWMIIEMCATLVCLGLGLTCAILRKFDTVTCILFAFIVVFSIVISICLWRDLVTERAQKELNDK